MQKAIRINGKDNVAVALQDVVKGERFSFGDVTVTVAEDIPRGHKFALQEVREGAAVVKYGFCIGTTKEPVEMGHWIHTHNLKTSLGEVLKYEYEPSKKCEMRTEEAYFDGSVSYTHLTLPTICIV